MKIKELKQLIKECILESFADDALRKSNKYNDFIQRFRNKYKNTNKIIAEVIDISSVDDVKSGLKLPKRKVKIELDKIIIANPTIMSEEYYNAGYMIISYNNKLFAVNIKSIEEI